MLSILAYNLHICEQFFKSYWTLWELNFCVGFGSDGKLVNHQRSLNFYNVAKTESRCQILFLSTSYRALCNTITQSFIMSSDLLMFHLNIEHVNWNIKSLSSALSFATWRYTIEWDNFCLLSDRAICNSAQPRWIKLHSINFTLLFVCCTWKSVLFKWHDNMFANVSIPLSRFQCCACNQVRIITVEVNFWPQRFQFLLT